MRAPPPHAGQFSRASRQRPAIVGRVVQRIGSADQECQHPRSVIEQRIRHCSGFAHQRGRILSAAHQQAMPVHRRLSTTLPCAAVARRPRWSACCPVWLEPLRAAPPARWRRAGYARLSPGFGFAVGDNRPDRDAEPITLVFRRFARARAGWSRFGQRTRPLGRRRRHVCRRRRWPLPTSPPKWMEDAVLQRANGGPGLLGLIKIDCEYSRRSLVRHRARCREASVRA